MARLLLIIAAAFAVAGCDDDTTTRTTTSDLAMPLNAFDFGPGVLRDLSAQDLASAPGDGGGGSGGTDGGSTQMVASIVVAPSPAIVPVATTMQLTATAQDAQSQPIPGITFVWTTADAMHAAVDSNGLVSAMLAAGEFGVGPVSVSAAASGKSGATNVFVAIHPTWDFAAGAANVSVDAAGGQYIVFHNDDGAPHTVVLDSGTALTGSFASGDSSPVHVTLTAGFYTFHCSIHPTMHGTLVVH